MHYQMLIQLVNAEMGQIVNAIPSPSQNQHCDDMIPLLPITLYESTPINGRKYQNAHQPPTFSFDPKAPSNYLCSSAHVALDHHSPLDLSCLLTASSHLMQTFN